MPTIRRSALVTGLALTAIALASCAGQGPPQTTAAPGGGPSSAGPDIPSTVDSAVLAAGGRAFLVVGAQQLVTTDAGASWSPVQIPGTPLAGHAVDLSASGYAAVTVEAGGALTYRWSRDSGRTWSSQDLSLNQQQGEANIAVADDGSVAIAAVPPHSSGTVGQAVVFAGPSDHRLTRAPSSPGGQLGWVGHSLLAVGGPLDSALFVSDDDGSTWAQSSVVGTATPPAGSEVAADTPNIGAPVSEGDRAVIPVTVHDGEKASLELLSTTDGKTFVALGTVELAGAVGSGVTASGTDAGPGTTVFVDPTSTRLIKVVGDRVSTFATKGLPSPPDALTFADATHAFATVPITTCIDGTKHGCAGLVTVFASVDAGVTWTAASSRP